MSSGPCPSDRGASTTARSLNGIQSDAQGGTFGHCCFRLRCGSESPTGEKALRPKPITGSLAIVAVLLLGIAIADLAAPALAQDDAVSSETAAGGTSGNAPATALDPIRVKLMWYHQAQFAGLYVADAKGFYEREGLDVEWLEGGSGIHPLTALETNEADVALNWLPGVIEARKRGVDLVNIGQLFQKSGTMIVCRRDAGVRRPEDVAGKQIGVWNVGDELNLRFWLSQIGIDEQQVEIVQQRPNGADLIEGKVACATAMTYNEYWTIIGAGLTPADLMVERLGDENLGFLEDGFYVLRSSLEDPVKRDALVRFLRASIKGWVEARDNPEETFAITMAVTPHLAPGHQQRMLESVLALIGDSRVGHLDLAGFDQSIAVIAAREGDSKAVQQAAAGAWTHALWYEAGLAEDTLLTLSDATRYRLIEAVETKWFLALELIGTAAFGLAGFMRAQQRRYDLWGAFILTLLPAAGGGTLRDLLIGRTPFIFQDPVYIHVILAVLIVGTIVSRFTSGHASASKEFDKARTVFDAVGMAAYATVGATVGILADLHWIWVPFCAALSCAGGGMLLDVVTGREPRTFQGEPYEEIAVAGGLLLLFGMQIADAHEHQPWVVVAAILGTLLFIIATRLMVVRFGLRSFRLGGKTSPADAE